jgi:hypothetical protein
MRHTSTNTAHSDDAAELCTQRIKHTIPAMAIMGALTHAALATAHQIRVAPAMAIMGALTHAFVITSTQAHRMRTHPPAMAIMGALTQAPMHSISPSVNMPSAVVSPMWMPSFSTSACSMCCAPCSLWFRTNTNTEVRSANRHAKGRIGAQLHNSTCCSAGTTANTAAAAVDMLTYPSPLFVFLIPQYYTTIPFD